jgi:hypothetical protein
MDLSDFRQAREYAAWLLLAAAVIVVGMGLWFLLGLPGSGGGTLADHGFAAAPDLIGVTVTLLPVAAVLLAALGGPAVGSLRQITLYAVVVQVVALILGVIAWLITFGGGNGWFTVGTISNLAVAVAGLLLTMAVLRSRAP